MTGALLVSAGAVTPVVCGGGPRSIRTVDPAVAVAGVHAEALPASSTERNWTRVSPSAVMVTDAPAAAALQVVPPSVLVRCS
jgi:hypothetical protein